MSSAKSTSKKLFANSVSRATTMSEQLPVERKREKSTTNLNVPVESNELIENQKRLKILAAQRLKERNDKYLEDLK